MNRHSRSRIYGTWNNIKQRCENKTNHMYYYYGGRGITLCDEWHNLETFMKWASDNGYSDDLTIDRIDNDRGYCPDNCRWATMVEQNKNKRIYTTNTSGIKGVYFDKPHGKFRARIGVNGTNLQLGYFDSIEAAEEARKQAEKKYW